MEHLTEIQKIVSTMARSEHGFDLEYFEKGMSREELEKWHAESYNKSVGDLNEHDGYNCDICKNKGWIQKAQLSEFGYWTTVTSPCKCRKTRAMINRLNRSGLKNIIRDYTFSKFEAKEAWQEQIKDTAIAFAKNPDGWFFLGGTPGCGKTHICTAICREFLLTGREVVYMLWRDDITALKTSITEPEKYAEKMRRYKHTDVLYIDDLFKTGKAADGALQRPTAADINAAFEILNYRYNERKITIISSESTVSQLLEIDEGTASRIVERSKAFSINPDKSKNYRLKGAVEI